MARFTTSLQAFRLGTNSRNFTDAFSFCQNPAAVVQTNGIHVGFYYEKRYLINELNLITGVIAIRKKTGGFGFELHRFKWSHFSQSFLGFVYGRSLGKMDLGIRMSYESMKIAGYSYTKKIAGEFGTILHLSEKVNVGIYFSIPGSANITYIYGAGIGYEISEFVFVGAGISKNGNDRSSSNVGLIYRPAKHINIKAGLITESRHPYLSGGWRWKNMTVEVTINYHSQLGINPGLCFAYQSGRKQE